MSRDVVFYLDAMVVETVLGDNTVYKTAQSGLKDFLSSLMGNFTQEVQGHLSQSDNKVAGVLDLLAPGAVSLMFGGKLGMLFGFLMSAFGIRASAVFSSVYEYVKEAITQGHTLTPQEVNGAVSSAMQQHGAPQSEGQPADTHTTASLKEAKLFRLALDDYERELFRLTKKSAPSRAMFDFWGPGARNPRYGQSVLGGVLRWLFKVVLISAGLMVAGDMTRKVLSPGSSEAKPAEAPAAATQTKFPVNPDYQNEAMPHPWEVPVPNTASSIDNMLVNFTKDVYSGLEGKESLIRSAPNFQAVRDQIAWFNHMAAGEPSIFIPSMYANKKALVDQFIGQVAKAPGA